MFIEQSNFVIRLMWKAVWRINDGSKTVYLTFDDGPCPKITPQTLDILDKFDIKATFFCVGDNVRKYPEIFESIKQRGHAVGNHTMHHLKGFNTDFQAYINDIEEANSYIKSSLLRPPYGRITFRQLRELRKKYKIVMWDVITRDYNPYFSSEKIFSIVKKYTRKGSIIVFHDSEKSSKNMLETLPNALEWLKNQGYEFKTLAI
ncbi:MAG: polysaccharide deacetylase family protein [Prevotellaceae bacterium]|jgi:peptidoglycan/xylan/chitin deacetylase (PgdA/CDA1 family)|nr:polysaccharide deacetylase family protein [Prevotellaceae bacterium]